jgi:hypothetical protein
MYTTPRTKFLFLDPIVCHGDFWGYIDVDIPERNIKVGMCIGEVNYEDLLHIDMGKGERIPTL